MAAAILALRPVQPGAVSPEGATNDLEHLFAPDRLTSGQRRLICQWRRAADGRLVCSWEMEIAVSHPLG